MANSLKDDEEVGKLAAIFWAEFAIHAVLPVDYDCLDIAMDKDHLALENIKGNKDKLKPPKKKGDPATKDFNDALTCARSAGTKAKRFADRDKKGVIDTLVFDEAWKCVQKACIDQMKREERNEDFIKAQALIC